MLKIRKVMKMHKDNPNIRGISIVNGQIKIIEEKPIKKEEIIIESYVDPICKKQIKKQDAYRVIKDGKEYFFCSWECREAFVRQSEENQ
jgi:YHS domain-containing protein